jgi:DNA-binding winged helix-turn-helix (wHTH) protein
MQLQLIARKAHGNPTRTGYPVVIERAIAAAPADTTLEFGRFCLLPRRRRLLADGVPVELGARAFDLLLVLIEVGGNVIGKDELLNRVWSGVVVEENSLHVQMSALRRALGKDRDFIQTVSGRGYCFTAPVRESAAAPDTVSTLARQADPTEFSHRLRELSEQLAELAGQLGSMLAALRGDETATIARPWNSETQTH